MNSEIFSKTLTVKPSKVAGLRVSVPKDKITITQSRTNDFKKKFHSPLVKVNAKTKNFSFNRGKGVN